MDSEAPSTPKKVPSSGDSGEAREGASFPSPSGPLRAFQCARTGKPIHSTRSVHGRSEPPRLPLEPSGGGAPGRAEGTAFQASAESLFPSRIRLLGSLPRWPPADGGRGRAGWACGAKCHSHAREQSGAGRGSEEARRLLLSREPLCSREWNSAPPEPADRGCC